MLTLRKMSGAPIDHPLGKMGFPECLPEERVKQLATKLRQQQATQAEIEELAEGHIRQAISVASKFAARQPHKADLFVAEALYGVSYAIAHAPKRLRDDNIGAYIYACVIRFVLRCYQTDRVVGVSDRTIRNRRQRGLETQLPTVVAGAKEKIAQVPATEPRRVSELREVIENCVTTDFESRVVNLREQGYKDSEISEKLACSRQLVQDAKSRVYARFRAAMEHN
jgi:hypothetical protein